VLSRALARQPLVVDPDQFAESEPVIMRYRLNSDSQSAVTVPYLGHKRIQCGV
jgi:hypothetical protein